MTEVTHDFSYIIHHLSSLQRQTDTKTQAHRHTHKKKTEHMFTLGDGPGPASTVMEAPILHCGAKRATAGPGQPRLVSPRSRTCVRWDPDIDSLSLFRLCSLPLFVSLFLFLLSMFSFDLLQSHGSGSAQNLFCNCIGIQNPRTSICIPSVMISVTMVCRSTAIH